MPSTPATANIVELVQECEFFLALVISTTVRALVKRRAFYFWKAFVQDIFKKHFVRFYYGGPYIVNGTEYCA